MPKRLTVLDYLAREETTRPQELAYGILREPAAPSLSHQVVLGELFRRIALHVRRHALGLVVTAPLDVVLDKERALIVQPDLVYVSVARQTICTDRVWGAPDMVLEVLSFGTRRHDQVTKVQWYRQYGVQECWLVDPVARNITVLPLAAGTTAQTYDGEQRLRSAVLPRLRVTPLSVFR